MADRDAVVDLARAAFEIGKYLEIEKLRNAREEKRIALQAKALELADAQDRRQYEFHQKSLERRHERANHRLAFGRRLTWIVLAGIAGFLIVLFGLLFFGSDSQRVTAQQMVTHAGIALAGYGVISGVLRVARSVIGARE